MTRAALYARISKDSTGKRLGVERQQELCRNLAEAKGWEVVQTYTDNDLSAYRGAPRPAYEQMLQAMEAGTIDAVVCVDQDRLTRHPAELESFIALADAHNIALANVSGDIDFSTSDGRFRARIMGAVARQESEKKSERIRRQKEQSAAKGHYHGGRRPFGYQISRKDGYTTLEIDTDEAEVIRRAAQEHLDGVGLRAIAVRLNDESVSTVEGNPWRQGNLRNILTSPSIAGLRQHRGEIVGEASWEPILDRATWERLRAKIGNPRQPKGGRPPTHLLSGLLTCHKCGSAMFYSSKTNPKGGTLGRYNCPPAPQGCSGTSMADKDAEAVVIDQVLSVLDTPEMAEVMNQTGTADAESITAEIEAAEESLKSLARMHFVDRAITEAEYLAAREGLDEKITGLQSRLAPAGPLAGGRSFRELWNNADTEARRAVIGEVVESMVVGAGVRGRRTVDPDRISIKWKA